MLMVSGPGKVHDRSIGRGTFDLWASASLFLGNWLNRPCQKQTPRSQQLTLVTRCSSSVNTSLANLPFMAVHWRRTLYIPCHKHIITWSDQCRLGLENGLPPRLFSKKEAPHSASNCQRLPVQYHNSHIAHKLHVMRNNQKNMAKSGEIWNGSTWHIPNTIRQYISLANVCLFLIAWPGDLRLTARS